MESVPYKSLLYGEKNLDNGSPTSYKWWNLKNPDERADAIISTLRFLNEKQTVRKSQLNLSTRLYGNVGVGGYNGFSSNSMSQTKPTIRDRITYNVCSSTVDTIASKIAKNKPKPLFLTSGGDSKLQSKAKKLTKFVDGCFYANKMYELGPEIFRDAAVWGDGITHVYNYYGQVKAERILVAELYVDEIEAFYGNPRQLHRAKNVDRGVLFAQYPKHSDIISIATSVRLDNSSMPDNISDLVTIVESWHLPSNPKAKDGMHVIAIDKGELLSEQYTKDHYPFAKLSWSKRMYGYYSQGLVEQIQNIQTEINKLLWVIQRSMHLAGSFKILLENGSKIVKEHLNNDIGAIVTYTGTEPSYITPPIVPPEIYSHLQTLKAAAYEQAGVSQLSAAAKKPDGLNSGKALREYNDIESDRFMLMGQAYENYFLDVAKLMVETAREIYEDDKSFSINVPGKKFIETIKWSEVDLPDDQYILQVFPVSKLPDEPAGRLQTVTEMMQAGLISPDAGRRLLAFPDLEAEDSLATAQQDWLHKVLDGIIEGDDYIAPESTDNLALAEVLALEYINRGRFHNLEQERLDLLDTYLIQVRDMQKRAAMANQPALPPQGASPMPPAGLGAPGPIQGSPMPPGIPQANPAPLPQSELVQNTPSAPLPV